LRSSDGGSTWTDLRRPLKIPVQPDPTGFTVSLHIGPLTVTSDSRRLYAALQSFDASGSAHIEGPLYVATSSDTGLHWSQDSMPPGPNSSSAGAVVLFSNPFSPTHLYALFYCGGCVSRTLSSSADAGNTWEDRTDPLRPVSFIGWVTLVSDPRHLTTLYANVAAFPDSGVPEGQPLAVTRSTDDGATWTRMNPPVARPPLRTFSVSTDAHLGSLLVGRTQDRSVPADRRYLSRDEGRTWRVATCPGDVRGQCPTYTVDNVFGAGASYGFVHASPDGRVRSGVYRFHGSGVAVARLALSARLPVRIEDLLDVQAGHSAGDPIYLLSNGDSGTMHGLLWRSTDGGRTWQQLLGGVQLTPNAFLRTRPRP